MFTLEIIYMNCLYYFAQPCNGPVDVGENNLLHSEVVAIYLEMYDSSPKGRHEYVVLL